MNTGATMLHWAIHPGLLLTMRITNTVTTARTKILSLSAASVRTSHGSCVQYFWRMLGGVEVAARGTPVVVGLQGGVALEAVGLQVGMSQ